MDATRQLCNWLWWRNWIAISISLAAVIVVQFLYWLSPFEMSEGIVQFMVFASVSLTTLSVLAIFTFGSDLDFSSGRTAFPQRFFTLPIGSIRIALVPVIGMLVATAWCWIPAAWISLHSMSDGFTKVGTSSSDPFIYLFFLLPWLAMSALGNWLQAITWWPYRAAWHRLFCIVMFVVLVVGLLVFSIDAAQAGNFWTARMVVVFMSAMGFSAAILSVTKARHLAWRSEASAVDTSTVSTATDSENAITTFATLASFGELPFEFSPVESSHDNANEKRALSAIEWRDWRQVFRIPCALMLMFAAPIALAMFLIPLLTHLTGQDSMDSELTLLNALLRTLAFMAPLMLFAPPFILVITSPSMGKSSYWKREFALSHYVGGLPISDEQFLASRFKGILKTSFAAWLCAFVVILLWALPASTRQPLGQVLLMNGLSEIWPIYATFIVLASLYLSLVAPWPGMVIGLFGRGKLGTAMTFALIMGFVIGLSFLFNLANRYTEEMGISLNQFLADWSPIVLPALLISKLILATVVAAVLISRRLIDWSHLLKLGLILTTVCLVTSGLFVLLLIQDSSISRATLTNVAMLVILFFPCASLLLSRIAIDANRHR